ACSGGNSRLSRLSGVGGGNFTIKRLFWGEQLSLTEGAPRDRTTWLADVISFRAKSPTAGKKEGWSLRLLQNQRRLCSEFFPSPKLLFPIERIPSFIIRLSGLRFRLWCFILGSRQNTDRPFKVQKRCQYFICTHNVTLSIIAMCVSNPDRAPSWLKR